MEVHSNRSDADIIHASLDSPSEFGAIFLRHYDRVYAYAARRIGVAESEDVAAEVFVKAFRIRHRYDENHPSCLAWLLGIAHNTVGDRLRATRRRERVYLRLQGDTTPSMSDEADARVVADSLSEQLNDALGKLPTNDREAFLLYAIEEFTYAEIAVTLGIPPGTVGSRVTRARRKITQVIPNLRQISERMHDGGEEADGA